MAKLFNMKLLFAVVLCLASITAYASQMKPKHLDKIESAIGKRPEQAVYGQFVFGTFARNALNARTAYIAFDAGTLYVLTQIKQRELIETRCEEITDVQIAYRGAAGAVATIATADRLFRLFMHRTDGGQALLDSLRSCLK
ncbi:MAG: hypothetical protein ABI640_12880 [Gammaproteobacteria bacterium]